MNVYLAEFLGTLILILLGNGIVAGSLLRGSIAENSGWLTIVIGWGLAVTLAVFAVGNISGAHINPAVTIALAYAGDFPWDRVGGYVLAQLGGAFTGAILVWIHYFQHFRQTEDQTSKLAVFSTVPAIRNVFSNLISEILATAVLVLGLLFIGANKFAEGLNPLVVGLLIIAIGLSLGGTTGFAINPARDLGPRIAHFILPIEGKGKLDWSYAWIPIVGPIIGGLLGAMVYLSLFN